MYLLLFCPSQRKEQKTDGCFSSLHLFNLCRIRAPGGDTEALLQVAAQLYQIQGRYDLALAIYLRQQQPAVFDFIQEHHLLPVLHERVAQLLSIDEERATQLLMDQYDEVPASTVVPSIQVSCHQLINQSIHAMSWGANSTQQTTSSVQ